MRLRSCNHNHGHLIHTDDYEPNKVYPTPRSWVRFNECVVSGNLLDGDGAENNAIVFNLAQGFVGLEGAVAFTDFRKNYERQVTIEDLLDDRRFDKIKDWGINDHLAMIEKIDSKDILAKSLNKTQTQNLVDYMDMLPSECALKLWQMLGSEGANDDNMIAIHQSRTSDGTPVSAILVRMYVGVEE